VFESSTATSQSEEVKQFWKTLILPPPIESSLYSKEILQKTKKKPVKEMSKFGLYGGRFKRAESFHLFPFV
jgi:hypothetical protein